MSPLDILAKWLMRPDGSPRWARVGWALAFVVASLAGVAMVAAAARLGWGS